MLALRHRVPKPVHRQKPIVGVRAMVTGSPHRRPLVPLGVIAAVACAFAATLNVVSALAPLDLALYDRWVSLGDKQGDEPSQVAVVVATEQNLQTYGWPLSDGVLTDAITTLLDNGAVGVGIDLFRDRPVPPGSDRLETLLVSDGRVVWLTKFGTVGRDGVPPPAAIAGTNQVGFSDLVIDQDGSVRRALLFLSDESHVQHSLALRMLVRLTAPNGIPIGMSEANPDFLSIGPNTVPPLNGSFGGYHRADDAGYQIMLDFRGGMPRFDVLTLAALLDGDFDPSLVQGKLVILGVTAVSINDHFFTSLDTVGGEEFKTDGVFVHALSTDRLVRYAFGDRAPIRAVPPWAEHVVAAVAAVLGVLLGWILRGPVRFPLALGGAAIALLALGYWSLMVGYWVPMGPALAAFLPAALVSMAYALHVTALQRQVAVAERQRADELNQAKSAFLAMMSHEIRTPMNGVLAMSDLLTTTPLTRDQAGMVNVVQESGRALIDIIDDILDFSKIQAGKLALDYTDVDISAVLEGCLDLMAAKAQEKTLDLVLDVDAALAGTWRTDAVRVRQIVLNLVSNAIKFTSTGGVQIHATLTLRDAESAAAGTDPAPPWLLVRVIDSGVGITDDQKAKLFRPFEQADASTTREYGGTGLGLAICRNLIELLGGEIGVDSLAGRGSTFWFKIPVTSAGTGAPATPSTIPSPIRVLIADPSATMASFLRDGVCKPLGWSVTTIDTLNGLIEILDSPRRHDHDMVVLCRDLVPSAIMTTFETFFDKSPTKDTGLKLVLMDAAPGSAGSPLQDLADRVLPRQISAARAQSALLQALAPDPPETEVELAEPRRPRHRAPTRTQARDTGVLTLVAEDNPINRVVIARLLDTLGVAYDMAENGEDAFERYHNDAAAYGLVITDCNMPVMDGFALTQKIRDWERQSGRERVPVVALTADVVSETLDRCREAGMDRHLTKPASLDEVEIMVAEVAPRVLASRQTSPGSGPDDDPPLAGPCTAGGIQAPDQTWQSSRDIGDPDPATGHLDLDGLIQIYGGLNDDVRTVLADYLPWGRTLLIQLGSQIDDGDFDAAAGTAHTARGASNAIGATGLGRVLEDLEAAIRSGDGQNLLSLSGRAEEVFLEVEREITRLTGPPM